MVKYRVFQAKLHPEKDAKLIARLESAGSFTDLVRSWANTALDGAQAQTPAAVDLVALRQVFEAVIDEKLSGAALVGSQESGDPELENKLDAMF